MRKDFSIISNWVEMGCHVVDLGCGDGELFHHLQISKQVTGFGVDNDHAQVNRCLEKSVPILQQDIEYWLHGVASQSIDYVILSHSIQTLTRPDLTMQEILRVGKRAIISFPNMAYWNCRLQLALQGRMPVSKALPAQWYDTKNIHLCTISDFENLLGRLSAQIQEKQVVLGVPILKHTHHNLFAESILYLIDGD